MWGWVWASPMSCATSGRPLRLPRALSLSSKHGVMDVTVTSLVCRLDPSPGQERGLRGPWSVVLAAQPVVQASAFHALSFVRTWCFCLRLCHPFWISTYRSGLKMPPPFFFRWDPSLSSVQSLCYSGNKIQVSQLATPKAISHLLPPKPVGPASSSLDIAVHFCRHAFAHSVPRLECQLKSACMCEVRLAPERGRAPKPATLLPRAL